MRMDIWRNPLTGGRLAHGKDCRSFVDSETNEEYPIDNNGIIHFICGKDIQGSNTKSTAFYNSFSPFYELGQKLYYSFLGGERKARNDYLKYLDIQEGSVVLEVSVGTAANIKYLPREAEYYGLDISMGQLIQSVKNRDKHRLPLCLCYGNAEYLPFADSTFDVVFHIGGINLFSDKGRAIREMVRVAKPGTKLLIADETNKIAKAYKWIPYFGKPFRGQSEIVPPVNLLPDTVADVKLDEIRHGSLYCLTFKKPLL